MWLTRAGLADWLQRAWQTRDAVSQCLLPVAWLYGALVFCRRWLYSSGWLKSHRIPVPVVTIGNVVVGGAGKTPVTMAVLRHLMETGWSPGVVSRGYGRSSSGTQLGDAGYADPAAVGDEPALISRRCSVPVAVAANRHEAACALLAQYPQIDILVCDDGLQHLALGRDVEICVFGAQGIGNGRLLPAGPLREKWPRSVDMVLFSGHAPPGSQAPAFAVQRRLAQYAWTSRGERIPLDLLCKSCEQSVGTQSLPLVAVAGTAQPEEFFAMLRASGIELDAAYSVPDHFNFDSWMPSTSKRHRLICTEKDAVKLWQRFPDALAVPLELTLESGFFAALDSRLSALVEPPATQ